MIHWAKNQNIRLEYIEPGKPEQNAYIERFNQTVRYDWLNQHLFETIEQVQEQVTKWRWIYNNEGPNTVIGGITLKQKLAVAA